VPASDRAAAPELELASESAPKDAAFAGQPAAPQPAAGERRAAAAPAKVRGTVHVDEERLDRLLETIGELVIAEANVSQSLLQLDGASDRVATQFSRLDKISRQWDSRVGKGTAVNWPVGLGGKGNEGVTGLVKQTPFSIGYVELIYAISNELPYADVKNAAGNYVKASLESVTAAAAATASANAANASLRAAVARGAPSSDGETTSCFQRRSECSRANSRESASRSPIRLTAMRKASSVASPASECTNQLIYDGCCPVRDALDVLIALGLSTAERGRAGARRRRPTGDDGRLFALFDSGDSLDIETIVHSSGGALGEVALALGRLEDAGFLERNGAWWRAT
jgi:hypothetical protein